MNVLNDTGTSHLEMVGMVNFMCIIKSSVCYISNLSLF